MFMFCGQLVNFHVLWSTREFSCFVVNSWIFMFCGQLVNFHVLWSTREFSCFVVNSWIFMFYGQLVNFHGSSNCFYVFVLNFPFEFINIMFLYLVYFYFAARFMHLFNKLWVTRHIFCMFDPSVGWSFQWGTNSSGIPFPWLAVWKFQ